MKLLILEDNQPFAADLLEIFLEEGFDARAVRTVAEAQALLGLGFEIALLDVQLPDGRGTDLLASFRRANPDAEIILMTGNADLDSAIEAVRGGAMAYLLKPVRIEELLLAVGRAREQVTLRSGARALSTRLAESERTLRQLVSAVAAVIVELGPDGRMRFVSAHVEDLLGIASDELLGQPFAEKLASRDDADACRAQLREVFEGGLRQFELSCLGKGGAVRRMHWRWSEPRSLGGAVVGVGTDVTEQRELERRMRATEQLAMAGTLTAGLAHEIRNPLNAAILQLSLVLRLLRRLPADSQEPLRPPLEVVGSELRRLDTLLEDFLQFARPREYRAVPVDLAQLVDHVVELEGLAARERDLDLSAHVSGPVVVAGDPDALRQILVNLVNNALAAAKSKVELRLRLEDEHGIAEIVDDGEGMAPELLERVFEPFFTTKSLGTGLGLPIVLTLVRSLGGEIEIDSTPGKGTTARLKFSRWTAPSGR